MVGRREARRRSTAAPLVRVEGEPGRRVAGEVVAALLLGQLAEQALADGVRVGGGPEVGPGFDGGTAGVVDDVHHVDLTVPVEREVDGGPDVVP